MPLPFDTPKGIQELAEQAGWNDSSLISLMLDYLRQEDLLGQLERHLQTEADDENDQRVEDSDKYAVPVYEIRRYKRTYHVIAKSEEEAAELAEKGETEWESEAILDEVESRELRDGVPIQKLPWESQ